MNESIKREEESYTIYLASYWLDSGILAKKSFQIEEKGERERESTQKRGAFEIIASLLSSCDQENNHHHNHQVF